MFGSCIIHILKTGCAKFKRKFQRQIVNKVTLMEQMIKRDAPCYTKHHSGDEIN
jgi:hypothetical protein